jgi:hypothetical protein
VALRQAEVGRPPLCACEYLPDADLLSGLLVDDAAQLKHVIIH